MKKLLAVSVAVGVVTASCSAGRMGSLLPQTSGSGASVSSGPSAEGTRSTRALTQAAAPPGWANTMTQVFSLSGASDLGVLPATQSLTVRVGLQLHNVNQLKSLVQTGSIVSAGQFASQFAPTSSDVSAVTKYLTSAGLTNVAAEPNNVIVSATGTAAQISKAFDTTLHSFSQNGTTIYANTAPAYVPQALNGIAIAVLGLNNAQTFKTTNHTGGAATPHPAAPAPTPTPQPESPCDIYSVGPLIGLNPPEPEPTGVSQEIGCLRNFSPSDFWNAYDAHTTPAATNTNIAIMAEGNVSQAVSDFRVNEQGDALVQVPVVVKQVGLASTDTSGDDEWTLDMSASTGMARAVKTVYLYATTSLTDSDIALEYNHWVTDDLAPIGNSSFGGCEYGPYLDGSMVIDDEILLQGASQGQSMFVSTGDTGSFCSVGTPNGIPVGAPLVEYPAASPYVTAVGGTTLFTQTSGVYQGELPWYSGGGGLSQFEYSPYWESPAQPVGTTSVGFTFRGLPDIAFDADLQTGMTVYTGGTWEAIGGTSLASPLAAGMWARMMSAHGNRLGFAPVALYRVFNNSSIGTKYLGPPVTEAYGPYHDIMIGTNGLYQATQGYDYTTGLGSVDVDAMNAVVGS